ncbi:GntR family transcriptional regulator [Microbacterium indicum]|uniref:GntR family transcriptional regulator n=1 Tax=Microbacterium indicum TaxID=358100 RepID=UPI000421AC0A|nr:GntR family transcriptional regulator [Microbacterium indicum]
MTTTDSFSAGGALLAPVRPPRLSDEVFSRLVQMIRTGELGPGDAIADKDLANAWGISRVPVREAVHRLEYAGVADVWASRFTRVRDLDDAERQRLVAYLGEITAVHLRYTLEPGSGEASRGLAPVELAARDLADAEDWGSAFTDFMEEVAAAAPDSWRGLGDENLVLMSLVLREPPLGDDERRALSEDLAAAVAARDVAGAERSVRALFGLRPIRDVA